MLRTRSACNSTQKGDGIQVRNKFKILEFEIIFWGQGPKLQGSRRRYQVLITLI